MTRRASIMDLPPNPLSGFTEEQIRSRKEVLVDCGLKDYRHYFDQAFILAQDPLAWQPGGELAPGSGRPLALEDFQREELRKDIGSIREKLMRQPWAMWQLILLCALGAMVQGWDEAAVNGAQVYYQFAFGISDPAHTSLLGIINGAPYLCCFVTCWILVPLGHSFGRRWIIFIAALCSAGFCIGQAFSRSWEVMFVLRFLLGLGIGPKSAIVPVYAAECAPADIRGALVMMWQLFTALGIMFGYLSGVAFANVLDGTSVLQDACPDPLELNCSLNWRLMIGSPMVAPIFLALYIFVQPESPRWLIYNAQKAWRQSQEQTPLQDSHDKRARRLYGEVFASLVRLRGGSKLKAARDMLITDLLLSRQADVSHEHFIAATNERRGWFRHYGGSFAELFTERRNYSALRASSILMFLQQFCGINVLIYYSTLVLFETSVQGPRGQSLRTFKEGIPIFMVASFGVGAINFFFGLPAVFLIDKWGRRKLLLLTFPLMALFQALVALGAIDYPGLPNGVFGLVITGMYLFCTVYSFGEGPVPFTYAAESFPQATRDLGMGVVTSLNWGFNFCVASSFPSMTNAFTVSGAFWFYAAWCLIGWGLIFFFVPETKGLTLEQLDHAFEKSMAELWRTGLQDLREKMRQKGRDRSSIGSDEEMQDLPDINGHATGYARQNMFDEEERQRVPARR